MYFLNSNHVGIKVVFNHQIKAYATIHTMYGKLVEYLNIHWDNSLSTFLMNILEKKSGKRGYRTVDLITFTRVMFDPHSVSLL